MDDQAIKRGASYMEWERLKRKRENLARRMDEDSLKPCMGDLRSFEGMASKALIGRTLTT